MRNAIILAAGKGRRMNSKTNKVMHPLLHKPLIGHVVDTLEEVGVDETFVVIGHQNESIQKYLKERVKYAIQDEQIGTADAVKKVTQLESKEGCTLVLFGDSALIQPETLIEVFKAHEGNDLTVATAVVKDAGRFNRVIRDTQGNIKKIVRESQATALEATSNEINLGVYCFNNELLYRYLPEIENDMKEELNIIDLVSIMRKNGHIVQAMRASDPSEFIGVLDRIQLHESNKWLQEKINREHMANGVSILDKDSVFIGPDVTISNDVTIYPNVHIYGDSKIAQGVTITPGSWLENVEIDEDTTIESSKIINSKIGANTTVGPYAHIREKSIVGDEVRIGNFVELKTTEVGNHTSAAHLSYLGNAKLGKYVNIGCGVVTINYDGKDKHETVVEDHSFVGSHSALIAPVKVGAKAVVAAGSVISKDVEEGDLAISRSEQINKKESGKKYLSEKGKI
ncbi:MAG TPA: bifunctional UDP-N-acetylglucosamine diphosphorylase/glucosamine-1-phosphate N-acetyltransferase GlmU [Erysipelothrix sp.]|nr:bifunctional UDP-N-acetylglucosamine diphosphorylase/glucosamine-1-phosphate N-acetyltransferase GlmU [Erysipelothrix sp.]